MGLFDEVVGKATGLMGCSESGNVGLMESIVGTLTSKETGGLSGLVQSFQEKGLGDIISSWIGTGQNQPISAEQIQQGVGSDVIQKLAAKTGLSSEDLSAKLAEFLPGVIDKLTPDGTIPECGLFVKGMDFLKGKMSS